MPCRATASPSLLIFLHANTGDLFLSSDVNSRMCFHILVITMDTLRPVKQRANENPRHCRWACCAMIRVRVAPYLRSPWILPDPLMFLVAFHRIRRFVPLSSVIRELGLNSNFPPTSTPAADRPANGVPLRNFPIAASIVRATPCQIHSL